MLDRFGRAKYNTAPGKGIRDIVFHNISCDGCYVNSSLVESYDKDRMIDNILFENIVWNGKRVTSLEELNLNRINFVGKIRLK